MSITPPSNVPISINYTSRDYYAIREELIARVQDRIPTWTAADPADFGLALVEAFAYMGDLMSYYIDRNANENFITTATQRDTVVNIAQTYGYIPAGYRQATVSATFFSTSEDVITIPAGTVLSGDVVIGDTVQTVYFTTDDDATSDPMVDGGAVSTFCRSGRSVLLVSDSTNEYGELIGTSTGLPNMAFELLETPVVDNSIELYIEEGSSYSKWTQVQHLIDYGPFDQVFTANTGTNNVVTVTFGDGISGQIPVNSSQVRAKYTVGGGALENVSVGTLITLSYVPGYNTNDLIALQSVVTVDNLEVALGGSDPESTAQIRYGAPIALRANNRAVTLSDFNSLALQVSGVGKAKAKADIWTSVTLYIAPTRTAQDTDLAPGLDEAGDPTTEFTGLAEKVVTFLDGKTLLGTSVTIQPPIYVDVVLTVQYAKLPQYTNAEVEAGIKEQIVFGFGYVENDFAQTIYQQDIEYLLQQVPGVKTAKLTVLHSEGDTGLNTLTGADNEVFRFQEANLNIGSI